MFRLALSCCDKFPTYKWFTQSLLESKNKTVLKFLLKQLDLVVLKHSRQGNEVFYENKTLHVQHDLKTM